LTVRENNQRATFLVRWTSQWILRAFSVRIEVHFVVWNSFPNVKWNKLNVFVDTKKC
jgi:hypothetical protein